MQGKISLTPQEILKKDFKIDMRGYSLKEVDQFLDEIIGDYEQFNEIIRNYEQEKEEYLNDSVITDDFAMTEIGYTVIPDDMYFVLGDNTSNNNYVTAGKDIAITVTDGSLLNYGVEKVLLNAGGDLTMKVTDGTIGLPVQQAACTGSGCTGVGPKSEGSRDFTKSVNANIKGKVKAETNKVTKPEDLVINYAAIDSDMNIDTIKADGRVILTVDDDYGYNNTGAKRYNMVNARTDNSDTNVEGTGISLISNGSIGTKDNAVTFIQTGAEQGYSMDVLAENNINLKENSFNDSNYGRSKEVTTNKACTIIARKGDANIEFAGNTTIDNITAEGDLTVVTRGKNLEIKNLGHITDESVIPNDYLGPRNYGQQDGGYTKPDYRDEALPNHATVKALDINHNIRPTEELVDGGHEAWAGSSVKIDNEFPPPSNERSVQSTPA